MTITLLTIAKETETIEPQMQPLSWALQLTFTLPILSFYKTLN